MPAMQEGTGAGLIEFLDWAGDKGVMRSPTAKAYRVGAVKVLEIDEDGDSVDIRTLDVEDQLRRFERKRGHNYSTGSLKTYKTRFRKGVELYREWLKDPGSFTGESTVQRRRTEPRPKSDKSDERASNGTQPERRPPSDDELLEYPFPLAQGGVAYLRLPRWLSTVDAERIGDHVKTLAIDRPADHAAPDGSGT